MHSLHLALSCVLQAHCRMRTNQLFHDRHELRIKKLHRQPQKDVARAGARTHHTPNPSGWCGSRTQDSRVRCGLTASTLAERASHKAANYELGGRAGAEL